MPELPEVEVTRLGLLPCSSRPEGKKNCLQRKTPADLPSPRTPCPPYPCRHGLCAIDRRAKYLLFRMDNGSVLLIHLGMTGKLSLIPSAEPYAVHDHLRLQLDNDMDLRYNDSRGSAASWSGRRPKPGKWKRLFRPGSGLNPSAANSTPPHLRARGRSKKQAVKNFLMDARMIAGIGNIYANEILFAAGIHPLSRQHHQRRGVAKGSSAQPAGS